MVSTDSLSRRFVWGGERGSLGKKWMKRSEKRELLANSPAFASLAPAVLW
jgi:hypothetical protein